MSNVQTYVVLITSTAGVSWPVGTATQRGFTEAGAESALASIDSVLPKGWICRIEEVQSLNELIDACSM